MGGNKRISGKHRTPIFMKCKYCDFKGTSRQVENHVKREHRQELFKKWLREEKRF